MNQILGPHTFRVIYPGTQILAPYNADAAFQWVTFRDTKNVDQPFTMSGTSLGRVTIPVLPSGNGADMLVCLYPDSGGNPNVSNLLSAALVPKTWITAMAAVNGIQNGGPLANAMFNGYQLSGGITVTPWAPAGSIGSLDYPTVSVTSSESYVLNAGGLNFPPGGTGFPLAASDVSSAQYLGEGEMASGVPQSPLTEPRASTGFAATSAFLVVAGGSTLDSSGFSHQAGETFTASWDPNTGVTGTWSQQADLPIAVDQPVAVAHPTENVVYVLGGVIDTGTPNPNAGIQAVYGTIDNGQIASWSAMTSLPSQLSLLFATAVGDWLVITGGVNDSFTTQTATYYMRLVDGIPSGQWRTGPAMPHSMYSTNQWGVCRTSNAMCTVGGYTGNSGDLVTDVNVLMVDDVVGPSPNWIKMNWSGLTLNSGFSTGQSAAFDNGDGSFSVINILSHDGSPASTVQSSTLVPVPYISVPLYATGLTNGATYHLVIKEAPGASMSDYLSFGIMSGNLGTAMRVSDANANSWSTYLAGYSLAFAAYSNTTGDVRPLHTWEDPTSTGSAYSSNIATRISTLVHDYDDRPIGLMDAVQELNLAINPNPTFTTLGVAGWSPHFCALTQSSAQVHGGFAFSGLMTPNGGNPSAYVESTLAFLGNNTPPLGTRWLAPNGWFYSTTGTSNFSLSVNWYDVNQTFISTSSKTVSLTAALWTNVVNAFAAPQTAVYATIVPTESGSPTSSNTVYMSNVSLLLSPESVNSVSTVVTIDYDPTTGFPTSVNELT